MSNFWANVGVQCVCVHAAPGKKDKGNHEAHQFLKVNEVYTITSMQPGDKNPDNIDVTVRNGAGNDAGPFSLRRFKPLDKSEAKTETSTKAPSPKAKQSSGFDMLKDILANPGLLPADDEVYEKT